MNIEVDDYFDIKMSLNKYIIYNSRYENMYDICYNNNLCFTFLYNSCISFKIYIHCLNINYICITNRTCFSVIKSEKYIKNNNCYNYCFCRKIYEFKNDWLPKDIFKDNGYINKFIIYFSIINYVIKNTKHKMYIYYYLNNITKIKKYNRLYHYKIYNYI